MPSRNVISVLIVCIAIIASVVIVNKQMSFKASKPAGILTEKSNIDWTVSSTTWAGNWEAVANSSEILNSGKIDTLPSTDETMTGQMARTFFGQYLSVMQNGGQVTEDTANKIAQNTLAAQDYTKTEGRQYNIMDIKVDQSSNKDLAIKYKQDVELIISRNTPKTSKNPMDILNEAVSSGDESKLSAIDPIIRAEKQVVSDLLDLQIPSDAVSAHLSLLNTISNTLYVTQSIREFSNDPVRAFSALSKVDQYTSEMAEAINNLETYVSEYK